MKNKKEAHDLLMKGKKCYEKENWENSLTYFKNAFQIFNKATYLDYESMGNTFLWTGTVYQEQQLNEKALKKYEQSIQSCSIKRQIQIITVLAML